MTHHTTSLDVTWHRPTFLLPLFCLCVLLASTESLTLALATALAMLLITLVCSLVYRLAPPAARQQASWLWLLLAGTLTALLETGLHASAYPLYQRLGMFLPMIAICCVLLARQEMQAETTRPGVALRRALQMSGGYALAAVVLGAGRELVGRGSLLVEAGVLWGDWAAPLELHFFRADRGFLLAVLAPGAFIALGLGVALYNWLGLRWFKERIR